MVQIKWLRQAISDLNEIYAYISQDSVKYAERQVERIWDRTAILKQHLGAGEQFAIGNKQGAISKGQSMPVQRCGFWLKKSAAQADEPQVALKRVGTNGHE